MKIYIYFALALGVSGCNYAAWKPILPHNAPDDKSVGYVSAHPSEPDLHYVSALEAAREEFETTADAPSPTHTRPHALDTSHGILGTPAGGTGVTLLNPAMRTRLNDALKTTPTGGEVTWTGGDLTYTLAPNSPVYIPQHSGGQCRDAVLTIFGDGFTNMRERSLFCQSGPRADWVIVLD